ncbi:MAG TPA: substrate-binding domain-containing protein [Polyangiaceae bacterium]|nr:substrate-binding domain-containing protein [Polyangiaceae bacterium]
MALPTIGLLIDWLDNDYAGTQSFAFFEEITGRGMRFLCFVGHGVAPSGERDGGAIAYRLASARVLDGLLVMSLGTRASLARQRQLIESFKPLPMCTLVTQCPGIPHVSVDNAAGMCEAVEHLIGVHHRRRIAFVRGPVGIPDADERFAGYVRALQVRGMAVEEALVAPGSFRREAGIEAVRILCDERRVPFDALVASNDAMAAGAAFELSRRGLRIPDDVAVSGFDDVEESRFADPPISSVRQPWRARARAAVDVLLELCAGRAPADRVVPAEFVPRRSCGCGMTFEPIEGAERAAFSRRVVNWDWRKATASGLSRDLALYGVRLGDAPARALVECFWQEIDGERDGGFMLLLEHELSEQLSGRSSVSAWYHGLSRLRLDMLERLEHGTPGFAKAEALIHSAIERVSYAAERQQALRRLSFERQCRQLVLAGQATSTAFNTDSINTLLCQQLPELGVPRFYVLQYEPGAENAELPPRSRLVLAQRGKRSRESEPLEHELDTLELLPRGAWPEDHAHGFVVEALHFQEERLGYALFEIGPRQGAIYGALREQLSTALKGAGLVRQVAQRALQREQAERARMQEELRIARRVQVSILPTRWQVQGLDVAAAMLPGQLPGADYFDVRPDEQGAWLCLGSVRGGGFGPGLIVPMLQSIVASLCRSVSPDDPVALLNAALRVLQQNVEERMGLSQSVNLLVARYAHNGSLHFAGDFEGVTLCPWHGSPFRPELSARGLGPGGEPLLAGHFQLAPHDLVLLHTQGLTRSSDFEDAPVGADAIGKELEKHRASPIEQVREGVMGTVERWSGKRADLSVIVGRRLTPGHG